MSVSPHNHSLVWFSMVWHKKDCVAVPFRMRRRSCPPRVRCDPTPVAPEDVVEKDGSEKMMERDRVEPGRVLARVGWVGWDLVSKVNGVIVHHMHPSSIIPSSINSLPCPQHKARQSKARQAPQDCALLGRLVYLPS